MINRRGFTGALLSAVGLSATKGVANTNRMWDYDWSPQEVSIRQQIWVSLASRHNGAFTSWWREQIYYGTKKKKEYKDISLVNPMEILHGMCKQSHLGALSSTQISDAQTAINISNKSFIVFENLYPNLQKRNDQEQGIPAAKKHAGVIHSTYKIVQRRYIETLEKNCKIKFNRN